MFVEDLRERYILGRWAYLIGEPYLSDIEYDELDKWFKDHYPNDEYASRHWPFDPCPIELLKKYNRMEWNIQTVMGYGAESIYSVNTQTEFETTFRSLALKSRVSFKIDGWNTKVSYYDGVLVDVRSRGRSGNSISINQVARMFPKKIPYKGRVSITGEMSIPNSKWDMYRMLTGNTDQRASIRTCYARGDIEYLKFLAFDIVIESQSEPIGDKYELLNSLGFNTPIFRWVDNYNALVACIKYMSFLSKHYDYLTDGLVIENSSYQLAIRLGEWKEKARISYVTGYEEKQGMYGVSMVVLMRPVLVEGKSCSRVSITNIANIVENNLSIGAPIAFNLRSSANNVINVTETHRLQNEWAGRYDKYKEMVEEIEGNDTDNT